MLHYTELALSFLSIAQYQSHSFYLIQQRIYSQPCFRLGPKNKSHLTNDLLQEKYTNQLATAQWGIRVEMFPSRPTFREHLVFHQPPPSRRSFLMSGMGSPQPHCLVPGHCCPHPNWTGRGQGQNGLPKQRASRLLETEVSFSNR